MTIYYSVLLLMASSEPLKASSKFQKYFQPSDSLREGKDNKTRPSAPPQLVKSDAMDLKTVVFSFEQKRVSQIETPEFNIQPSRPKPPKKKKISIKGASLELDEDISEKVYSPISRMSNNNTEKEQFLPHYQKRAFKNIVLFSIFTLLLLLEMVTTVFTFREAGQSGTNIVTIAFIILCSQAIYQLIAKHLLRVDTRTLSVRERMSKLKSMQENWRVKMAKKENVVSLCLIVLIIAAYWCYFSVLSEECLLSSSPDGPFYLFCDLYWANVLFPILLQKFYFTKSFQSKRAKFGLFVGLLVVMSVLILLSNLILFGLIVVKVCITVIRFRSQQDLSWISDVSSFLLIIGVILLIFARRLLGITNEDFTFLQLVLTTAKSIAIITIATIITRCVARVYLERKLFQSFFNQAHINLAFMLSSLLVSLPYLGIYWLPASLGRVLIGVGMLWVIYIDGSQSFEITLKKEQSDYVSL